MCADCPQKKYPHGIDGESQIPGKQPFFAAGPYIFPLMAKDYI